MEPHEFKAIRKSFDFSATEWGLALGYAGNRANIRQTITRYEKGDRPVPPIVARLAIMYEEYGIPEEYDPRPDFHGVPPWGDSK